MLDRIRDGRCDLVFDHIAGGGAATACDADGVPLIRWCAYYGDVSAIRQLLAHGENWTRSDPISTSTVPLSMATGRSASF